MAEELMSDRVRDVGDGLILAFPITETEVEGQAINTTRLYFFRVGSETRYFQKYTSLSSIASGNTTPTNGYDFLGDTGVGSGEDIFREETDDWHMLHFGFGTNNPNLEVFSTVSPDANGNPAIDRNGQDENITPGTDDRGWFAQPQIDDIYDPPASTEHVSFRNDDDGEFLLWAFHNDGPNTLDGEDLDLFFTGRGYKVQPVTNPETQDVMLQMAMSRPEDPLIDTIIHQVGGINDYTLGTEEPNRWGEVPDMKRTLNATDLDALTAAGEQAAASVVVGENPNR